MSVEQLRQNNPAITETITSLMDQTSDADLARALQQNSFVTSFGFDLEGVQRADWDSLLHVIAMRANLEKVELQDAESAEQRNAPSALVSAILRAIQQNTSVQTIFCFSLRLPTDVSTFLDTASTITLLSLSNCDMGPNEREHGTRDLAAALQRNTNIKTLRLCKMDDIYAIPILQSLQANSSLTTLTIGGESFSDATTREIQQLLESTTSIQAFELMDSSFRGDSFHPFAQSLIQSRIVSALKFSFCKFRDDESAAQFRSILRNKQNLTDLCLDCCHYSRGPVHTDIISAMLRSNSQLQSVELQGFSVGTTRQFQNLLRAVEKSKLERFVIGRIQSNQQFLALADSIPLMRVKELKVVFEWDFDGGNIEHVLLQAVKYNFSLRSIRCERWARRDLFDDDHKAMLEVYADRNECLDQWVENPETVEEKVWPDALKLSEKAGQNFVSGLAFGPWR